MATSGGVTQFVSDYWQEIPKNTGKQMLWSFATSGIVRAVVTSDIRAGLFTGAIAAFATMIHAFVTPIFLKFITTKLRMTWEEEMIRTTVAWVGAGSLAAYFGDNSVLANMYGMALLYGLWNYIEPSRRDLDRANWFGIMPDRLRF